MASSPPSSDHAPVTEQATSRWTAWVGRANWRSGLWWAAILAAWVYAAWFMLFELPRIPIFSRDTGTYLEHYWHRPIGYPLFLDAIYGVCGSLYVVVVVQAILGWVAVTHFARRLNALYQIPIFSALLAVMFITQVNLMAYHATLFSESLYITLILFSLSCLLGLVRRPSTRTEVLLSISAALPIAVRPTAIPLLAGLVVVYLFRGRRSIARAGRLFGPWLAIILALMAHNYMALGYPSIFVRRGKAMLANVAHLMPTQSRGPYAELANWLGDKTQDFDPERRRTGNYFKFERAKLTQFHEVAYSQGRIEGFVERVREFAAANPELTKESVIRYPWAKHYGKHHPQIAMDNVEYQLARLAIGNDFWGYVGQVASNWISYWYHVHGPMELSGEVYTESLNDPKTAVFREKYGVPTPAYGNDATTFDFPPDPMTHAVSTWLDTGMGVVHWLRARTGLGALEGFFLSGVAAVIGFTMLAALWLRRRSLSPRLVALAAILLFVHGHVMMMSLSHHALRRYMNVLEIFIIVAAYLAIRVPVRGWWNRLRRERRARRLETTIPS